MALLRETAKFSYKSPLDQKTDKGKIVVACSNCERPLVNILPSKSKADDIVTTFVVDCCHCGDKSYEETVKGLLSISPCDYVILIDTPIDTEKNIVRVITQKVNYTHD